MIGRLVAAIILAVVTLSPRLAAIDWPVVTYANALSNSSIASIAAPARATTTGNQILVGLIHQGTFSGCSDTATNTYTQVGSTTATDGGSNKLVLMKAYNITGNAANVVTCSFSANSAFTALSVLEATMSGTGDPQQDADNANGTGTAIATPSLTLTGNAVIFSVIVGNGSSIQPNNSFLFLSGVATTIEANTQYFRTGFKMASTSQAATATQTSGTWGIIAMAMTVPVSGSGQRSQVY